VKWRSHSAVGAVDQEAPYSEGVALVGAFVIPKPVLFSVGENDEGSAQVLGVAAGLLLGLVGVEVRPFGFQDAKRPAFSREHIIGTAAVTVEFKTDATVVQEIPAAVSERLVD